MKGRGQREDFINTIADKSAEQAILRKQDEIIDLLKALTAKLDADAADTGGDSDFAATLTDALEKVVLK